MLRVPLNVKLFTLNGKSCRSVPFFLQKFTFNEAHLSLTEKKLNSSILVVKSGS